ncbi:retrovirus-related pol polyprotein from transposon TNT 1-94 [Tanacetum coccineum]
MHICRLLRLKLTIKGVRIQRNLNLIKLMYLTSSRPDLIFAVCMCARYQAKPIEKHLNADKRVFLYLRGTINMGLWDLVQGNIMIKMVYYIEGLNYNLFLENDLLTGSPVYDLYTISLQETSSPTPICFLVKASPTQAWLWHRRLSHLNFNTINLLSKKDIVNRLPKLKYVKDQLCSSCELSKAKRSTFKTKTVPSSKGRPLYDEFFTVGNSSFSKSSSLFDNSEQQDTQPTVNVQPTTEPITPTTTVHAEENNNDQAEDA